MMKKRAKLNVKLDPEEQDILDSIERGEWETVPNAEEMASMLKEAARNYLAKDARITLRLSSNDLNYLKQKAAYKGLPYQTFIASVLHEYAAGHFIEVGV